MGRINVNPSSIQPDDSVTVPGMLYARIGVKVGTRRSRMPQVAV